VLLRGATGLVEGKGLRRKKNCCRCGCHEDLNGTAGETNVSSPQRRKAACCQVAATPREVTLVGELLTSTGKVSGALISTNGDSGQARGRGESCGGTEDHRQMLLRPFSSSKACAYKI